MAPEPDMTNGQQPIPPSPAVNEDHQSLSTSIITHQRMSSPPPPQNPLSPPSTINQQHSLQPEHNFPCLDLLKDNKREDFINVCVPLYNNLIKEDWEAATGILNSNKSIVLNAITEHYETVLHIAVAGEANTERVKFVDQLVKMMHPHYLKLKNKNGNTALCIVAAAGSRKIAEILVTGNNELLTIPNGERMMPLYIATLFKNNDMVNYLYEKCHPLNDPSWKSVYKDWLLIKCTERDRFDIALKVLENHKEFNKYGDILGVLARKPDAFKENKLNAVRRITKSITCSKVGPVANESEAIQLLRKLWADVVKKTESEITEILRGLPDDSIPGQPPTYPSQVLFVAAEKGNTKFIVELIHTYPDLIWKTNEDKHTIFHVAISHRHESIYNLLHEIGSMKSWIIPIRDSDNNNMLHLVGMEPKGTRLQEVSGVAFQLQRELLWFKEVESMVHPGHREKRNNFGLTPNEIFTKNHKELVSKSEQWMKGTANQCMVVAALIATIVFGVAYTLPGGYMQDKGFPVFLHNGPFIVFVAFDAISLILSTTSILVFLSILTSRYSQEDFLESLPNKLIAGLLTLFLSIVTMMIAFSASFFVLYRKNFITLAIVTAILALIPILTYIKLQYPLLGDVFYSTHHSRNLFKKKQVLYYQNPSV